MNYALIMVFSGNHVNTKVVVNLLNYLVLKFGGIWPSSLGDIAVLSLSPVLTALCLVKTDFCC